MERGEGRRGAEFIRPDESLVLYKSLNTLWFQDIISRYSWVQHFLLPAKNLAYWTPVFSTFLLIFSRHHSKVLTCGQNWHTDKIFFLLSFTTRSLFITKGPSKAFKTDIWNEFWVCNHLSQYLGTDKDRFTLLAHNVILSLQYLPRYYDQTLIYLISP